MVLDWKQCGDCQREITYTDVGLHILTRTCTCGNTPTGTCTHSYTHYIDARDTDTKKGKRNGCYGVGMQFSSKAWVWSQMEEGGTRWEGQERSPPPCSLFQAYPHPPVDSCCWWVVCSHRTRLPLRAFRRLTAWHWVILGTNVELHSSNEYAE